ncbi:CHAT domain-containing tetratricopeptide repeat protein [Luteolibacter marinus]|uniref:CHAT domain-containing tetratricopeptide repeat protein n=1 Tax=Luteolibacter marinus TaxID=2776705 RepID=UPI0018665770|nr:CHAT domain-containing protein [Luteolibacter marinus]
MFPPLRLWAAGLALILGAGRGMAEVPRRDLESLLAAEKSLAEADRQAGTPESRWAWIEAIARVGWARAEAGEHHQAAERYRAAIAVLPADAAKEEPEFVALLHDGLGRASQNDGDFEGAATHLTIALELRAAQPGGETQLGTSEGHLGLLELVRGHYAKAERLLLAAMDHTPGDRDDLLALRHDCLGRYYLALRAHELASMHYGEAIRHAAKQVKPDAPLMVDLRTNLALCRFRGGDPDGAMIEVEGLLDTTRGGADPLQRAGLLNLAATIQAATGESAAAGARIEEALDLLAGKVRKDHPSFAPILANLGAVRLQAGDAAGALEPLERAKELLLANVSDHHQALVEVLYQIAGCRLASGPPDEARRAVVAARSAAGELMSDLIASGSERELLTFRQQVDLHSIVCRLGDPALILDSLLGGKGRIMEAVIDRRSGSGAGGRRIDRLQAELDRLLLVPESTADGRIDALQHEIRELSLQAESDAAATTTVDWRDVSRSLPAGTAYVDCVRYVPAEGGACYGAVVVTREGEPRWIPLGEEKLLGRLDLLHRSLALRADVLRNGGGKAGIPMLPLLTDLYRAFWQPIAKALPAGVAEVILCPEAKMHLLPFAVLHDPDGRFLCEELAGLRVVDSGRRLVQPRQPAVGLSKPWAAVGVADFTAYRNAGESGAVAWPPRWAEALAGIGDLPTVRAEIRSMKQLAPAGSTILLDSKATEPALAGIVDPPAVLHFASHGFHVPLSGTADLAADPSALYENGILLRPGAGDDGILFPEEAGLLDLQGTTLVTLSTCRGALGRPVSGEGLLGLCRGFAKAGARNVMASLWEIPDLGTAGFMAKYYESLKKGGSPGNILWSMQAERLGAARGEKADDDAVETAILSFGGFTMTSL